MRLGARETKDLYDSVNRKAHQENKQREQGENSGTDALFYFLGTVVVLR